MQRMDPALPSGLVQLLSSKDYYRLCPRRNIKSCWISKPWFATRLHTGNRFKEGRNQGIIYGTDIVFLEYSSIKIRRVKYFSIDTESSLIMTKRYVLLPDDVALPLYSYCWTICLFAFHGIIAPVLHFALLNLYLKWIRVRLAMQTLPLCSLLI